MGWTHSIYNHISLRTGPDRFLVQPFGMLYSEVTPESLIEVDHAGTVHDPGSSRFSFSRAAFALHAALHAARPSAQCVYHTHTAASSALSAGTTTPMLLPLCQESLIVGHVSVHPYGGIVVDEAEQAALARSLDSRSNAMILRNHGLVTLGATAAEAFHYMFNLIYATEVQVRAMAMAGGDVRALALLKEGFGVKELVSGGGAGVATTADRPGPGQLELAAHIRVLNLPWPF